jgi:hypothetical protein
MLLDFIEIQVVVIANHKVEENFLLEHLELESSNFVVFLLSYIFVLSFKPFDLFFGLLIFLNHWAIKV